MNKKQIAKLLFFGTLPSCSVVTEKEAPFPNVILIYTDDVGYGDIGAYGGKIPTPNIDRLAGNGLLFTNAYATASTSTPSRFSLLTGEYAWRSPDRKVVNADPPAMIPPGKETWPLVMKRAGYNTSIIGKWHLGLGNNSGPDWNGKISPGPLEIGFDYAWIIPSTNDRVPTVFVENHYVVNLSPDDPIEVNFQKKIGNRPTGYDRPDLLKMNYTVGHNQSITNGISRIGYMKGGESALWRDEDIADILVEKAIHFIDQHKGKPFFMYFAPVDIHVPRIVHERFQGMTPYGPRGDMMAQLDWTVGALVKALEDRNLMHNTILIFSSDNGPVLDDGYADFAAEKTGEHKPNGQFSGGKYSAFEAGGRIPLIVHWPAKIKKPKTINTLFSQVDFLASFAAFLGVGFDTNEACDSRNHWKIIIGEKGLGRKSLVVEAIMNVLSYVRADGYKYIQPGPNIKRVPWATDIETGFYPEGQLYYLPDDPTETKNLANKKTKIRVEMHNELQGIIDKTTGL
jgi:arylsulfatase A-like enzyme